MPQILELWRLQTGLFSLVADSYVWNNNIKAAVCSFHRFIRLIFENTLSVLEFSFHFLLFYRSIVRLFMHFKLSPSHNQHLPSTFIVFYRSLLCGVKHKYGMQTSVRIKCVFVHILLICSFCVLEKRTNSKGSLRISICIRLMTRKNKRHWY